jgi:mono/diheme cytochrome c family protein
MLKKIAGLFSISIFLIACNSNRASFPKFLNKDSLPSQLFTINNEKDTSLNTLNGAIIKIAKGSFSTENVKLEVKEAYTIPQMILAGLTTQSDGKPLSSGGMIYINSVDKGVSIKKPINVSIPTNSFDNKMQLYKGEEKDGKIDWVDPESLYNIEEGKRIYESNCVSCHALNKILTAPQMFGTESRGPWRDKKELYKFIKSPARYIPTTHYTECLQHMYGQIMPSFPGLTLNDVNNIYDYIRMEELRSGFKDNNINCEDSCRVYDSLNAVLKGKINEAEDLKNEINNANGSRINYQRKGVEPRVENGTIPKVAPDKILVATEERTLLYKFDITSFGWYNIDKLLDSNYKEVTLEVNVDETLTKEVDVFIAIPKLKVFNQAGRLDNGRSFGFFTRDGKINLNPGTKVIVFVLGEYNREIIFDYKEFLSQDINQINLLPKVISKENFKQVVKTMNIDDLTMEANKVSGVEELDLAKKTIAEMQSSISTFRPKNCPCGCEEPSAIRVDSTRKSP